MVLGIADEPDCLGSVVIGVHWLNVGVPYIFLGYFGYGVVHHC